MADQTNAEVSDEREDVGAIGHRIAAAAKKRGGWDFHTFHALVADVEAAILAERRSVTSQASEGAEYWAVWSRTGAHIGTWDSEENARAIHLGQYPDGIVLHLYASPSKRVERLETALKPFADLNTRLERDYPGYKDAVSVFFELTHGDFRRAFQALQGGRS